MEEVGNSADAAFIHDWVIEERGIRTRTTERMQKNPPEGWSFLGEGAYRSTWRSPDGVAYKVQHQYDGYGQDNEGEYSKLRQAWECEPLKGVRLPKGSLYTLPNDHSVMAMECVAGKTVSARWDYWNTPEHVSDLMEEIGDRYSLFDVHSENVMYDDETEEVVPVDFGW